MSTPRVRIWHYLCKWILGQTSYTIISGIKKKEAYTIFIFVIFFILVLYPPPIDGFL